MIHYFQTFKILHTTETTLLRISAFFLFYSFRKGGCSIFALLVAWSVGWLVRYQLGPSSTDPVPPSTNYFSKYCLSIRTSIRDLHCLLGLVLLLNHRYIYIGTVCILLVEVFISSTIMVSIIVRAIRNKIISAAISKGTPLHHTSSPS